MTKSIHREKQLRSFHRLLDIMDDLREKCPWDRKQTMETLSSLTIEETYELIDAIMSKDINGVKEELGDLMLHLVFYAKIGSESNDFDISDALESVCDKLVRRHPHIYGDVVAEDEEVVKKNWESIKMQEGKKSVLQGVPLSLPALIKAQRMQDKAAQVGFEWDDISGVLEKLNEELEEFRKVQLINHKEQMTQEFGDILFSIVNYGRYLGIDTNRALELTNRKFKARFEYIEKHSTKALSEMTLEEMDELWDQAKL